jgi:hypothetical protein
VFAGLQRRTNQAGETSSAYRARNVVGFDVNEVSEQTIYQRNEELRTSALDCCTGVGISGTYRLSGQVIESSATLLHVLPTVENPEAVIEAHVQQLRAENFEVQAFVAGGDQTARGGSQVRADIENLLTNMNVPLELGPLSDGFASQYLTARIDNHGEVTFESTRGGY